MDEFVRWDKKVVAYSLYVFMHFFLGCGSVFTIHIAAVVLLVNGGRALESAITTVFLLFFYWLALESVIITGGA